jgi:hypothetical protein
MNLFHSEASQIILEPNWGETATQEWYSWPLSLPVDLSYLYEIASQFWLWDGVIEVPIWYPQLQLPYAAEEKRNTSKSWFLAKENIQFKTMNLLHTIEGIPDNINPIIIAAKKIQRKNLSDRRSTFIGVSRNGPNWQAMISINKRKSYIGTFSWQKEAAYAFDYYSLLIHGLAAKTNFTYTKDELMGLIMKFQNTNKVIF